MRTSQRSVPSDPPPLAGTAREARPEAPSAAPAPQDMELAALWARALADRTVLPVVRPETLVWSGGHGGRPLSVGFDAENPSDKPSRPVTVGIGLAGFGAFLPSRLVDEVVVPMLQPGGTLRVQHDLPAQVALPEAPAQLRTLLPEDPSQVPWAGSVSLWLEGRPRVERQSARLRCLNPGATSIAVALVHTEPDERLAFASETPAPGWEVRLGYAGQSPLAEGAWIAAPRPTPATLHVAIRPSLSATGQGRVTVHVTRASDGRCVPVEFELGG